MLQRTFCHIPGVGAQTERSLWEQGCHTWGDFLKSPHSYNTAATPTDQFTQYVMKSAEMLGEMDHTFFSKLLANKESWRAWPEFKSTCVYLDIETDGGQSGDSITTIGLYDGNDFTCLVKGEDLGNFPDIISNYGMIVTFFGAGFDIPMLRKAFPHVRFDHIHVDLCFALKQVGLRGGLKKIEKQLGIARTEDTDGLTGYDAIRLWREYLRGSERSLEVLIEYNREDVVNLETLAQIAYDRLEKATFPQQGSIPI